MLPAGLLKDRIEKLALDIYTFYEKFKEPLSLVCVMQGALRFHNELIGALRKIRMLREQEKQARPAYEDMYIRVSSYVGQESSGDVRIEVGDMSSLQGKHVLIVEDMCDTGRTLEALCEHIGRAGPLSVRSVCLLMKRVISSNKFEPDWIGFEVGEGFVVGFGMDCDEQFRDLEHLCLLA